jgi:hypothetical protein
MRIKEWPAKLFLLMQFFSCLMALSDNVLSYQIFKTAYSNSSGKLYNTIKIFIISMYFKLVYKALFVVVRLWPTSALSMLLIFITRRSLFYPKFLFEKQLMYIFNIRGSKMKLLLVFLLFLNQIDQKSSYNRRIKNAADSIRIFHRAIWTN